jgi:hypothetical protein
MENVRNRGHTLKTRELGPAILMSERSRAMHALECMVTGTGSIIIIIIIIIIINKLCAVRSET